MGGKSSLDKGKRGEREIIKLLQPIVDEECALVGKEPIFLQRNLLQAHAGGCDMHGLDWLSVEVKFQEQMNVATWWKQAIRQAGSEKIPVLFYRKSRMPWKVRVYTYLPVNGLMVQTAADISVEDFLVYFRLLFRLYL